MDAQLVQYLTGAAVTGAVGLLLKISRDVSSLAVGLRAHTVAFEEHRRNDRDDFQRVYDKVDAMRAEQHVVATALQRYE